ncbi:MAG: hypothetical protein IPK11_00905 [Ignavibacteria bacterium]|nr:hypothetical protein [Ignavibacteria bacterium]
MKYETKKIIITIAANGFILLCIWILANSYVGSSYQTKYYRFHTDDTTFVKAIQTIRKKYRFLNPDTSIHTKDDYIGQAAFEYQYEIYMKGKKYREINYVTHINSIKFSRDTSTTLSLKGFVKKMTIAISISTEILTKMKVNRILKILRLQFYHC